MVDVEMTEALLVVVVVVAGVVEVVVFGLAVVTGDGVGCG